MAEARFEVELGVIDVCGLQLSFLDSTPYLPLGQGAGTESPEICFEGNTIVFSWFVGCPSSFDVGTGTAAGVTEAVPQ